MKKIDYRIKLSVVKCSYGHYRIIYRCGNGITYKGLTWDSTLIDKYNDEETCTLDVCKQLCRIARGR